MPEQKKLETPKPEGKPELEKKEEENPDAAIVKRFVKSFVLLHEAIKGALGPEYDDGFIVQLNDQLTRLIISNDINKEREKRFVPFMGPSDASNSPEEMKDIKVSKIKETEDVDEIFTEEPWDEEPEEPKRKRKSSFKKDIPEECRNCPGRGGRTGTFCKKYRTHLWNAAEQCRANQ